MVTRQASEDAARTYAEDAIRQSSELDNLRVVAFIVAVLVAWLAGCAPTREQIGMLVVSGSGVTVNRQPAQSGTTIYSGDEVATDSGVSAVVLFADGGLIQLDENTDPFFEWHSFNGVRCLYIKLPFGRAAVDKSVACAETTVAFAVQRSLVDIQASSERSVLTLFNGTLLIERPQHVRISPGQETLVDARSSTVLVRDLTSDELRQRIEWRERYPGLPRDNPTGSRYGTPPSRPYLPDAVDAVPVLPEPPAGLGSTTGPGAPASAGGGGIDATGPWPRPGCPPRCQ